VLPLLIPSPNNRNDHGGYRDCYIINPASTAPAHINMYKRLGGIFAFSFMSRQPLPVNLPPIFWKQLLGETCTLDDLNDIDSYSAQVITELKSHGQSLSDEEFEAQGQVFTTCTSNGEEVDLVPDGDSKPVTKANLNEFIDLVLARRFSEGTE